MDTPLGADVVNAFIDPLFQVIKTFAGLDAQLAQIDLTGDLEPPPWLCATIEMRGKVVGPITCVVSEGLARLIARKLLFLDASEGVDRTACSDAVAELANIVSGNATDRLNQAGYHVEILPPSGTRDNLDHTRLPQRRLAVTLQTEAGRIKVLLGLRISDEE